jgi:type I restriction enzyme S subunit
MSSGLALKTKEAQGGRWKRYPAYKDSGVEWLGAVPEGWMIKRIGIDTKSLTGFAFESEQFSYDDEHIKLVRGDNVTTGKLRWGDKTRRWSEISNDLERYLLEENDIVIGMDGSKVGKNYAIVKEEDLPLILVQRVARIRCMQSLISRFLYYFIANDMFSYYVNITKTDPAVPHITLKNIRDHPICFPPLPEQHAIAAFLDRETGRIDALITKKERQIELLREKRAALISHAVTKGLDPDAPMKDSGVEWVGEVPEHWRVYRSKLLFREANDRSTTGEEMLLTVSHITGVTRRSEKNVTMFMAESLEGYKKCEAGDLVINTMWAWMGAMGIAPERGIVSPSYNVYRFRSEENEPSFYDYLFRTGQFVAEVICHSKGVWSSRLRLYPESFFEIRIPYPSQGEQREVVSLIQKETGSYETLQRKIAKSIEKLHEYRTALISAAVTGKIDVRSEET